VPTLVVEDKIFTESAGLLMFLSDRHPEAKLAPEPATAERGHFYQWLLYLSNTVQATMTEYFHPDWSFEDAKLQAPLKASAEARLNKMLAYIDDELGKGGPYLLGATFRAPDLYLHMLARWSRFFKKPAYEYRNIKRCVDLVKDRPAVQRMMAAQGLVHAEKA
jgi:glutathione S-transferase